MKTVEMVEGEADAEEKAEGPRGKRRGRCRRYRRATQRKGGSPGRAEAEEGSRAGGPRHPEGPKPGPKRGGRRSHGTSRREEEEEDEEKEVAEEAAGEGAEEQKRWKWR